MPGWGGPLSEALASPAFAQRYRGTAASRPAFVRLDDTPDAADRFAQAYAAAAAAGAAVGAGRVPAAAGVPPPSGRRPGGPGGRAHPRRRPDDLRCGARCGRPPRRRAGVAAPPRGAPRVTGGGAGVGVDVGGAGGGPVGRRRTGGGRRRRCSRARWGWRRACCSRWAARPGSSRSRGSGRRGGSPSVGRSRRRWPTSRWWRWPRPSRGGAPARSCVRPARASPAWTGLGPAALVGLRLAVRGHGRAVAVSAGAAVAVAGIVAALAFGSGIALLLSDPVRTGQAADLALEDAEEVDVAKLVVRPTGGGGGGHALGRRPARRRRCPVGAGGDTAEG